MLRPSLFRFETEGVRPRQNFKGFMWGEPKIAKVSIDFQFSDLTRLGREAEAFAVILPKREDFPGPRCANREFLVGDDAGAPGKQVSNFVFCSPQWKKADAI